MGEAGGRLRGQVRLPCLGCTSELRGREATADGVVLRRGDELLSLDAAGSVELLAKHTEPPRDQDLLRLFFPRGEEA